MVEREHGIGAVTDGNVVCDINTTPLIDVMLVLLVTLIVTLPVMTHAVNLDLPQAPLLSNDTRPAAIELEIEYDGTVVWDGTALTNWQQLESLLRDAARRTPQPEIHVHPDRRVKYDWVVKVLAAAQRNRLQRIGFADTAVYGD
jgi:biopolymer transport protein ExbD